MLSDQSYALQNTRRANNKVSTANNIILLTNVTAQVCIPRKLCDDYSNKAALHSLIRRLSHTATNQNTPANKLCKCCKMKAHGFNCQRICYTDVHNGQKKSELWSLYECTGYVHYSLQASRSLGVV